MNNVKDYEGEVFDFLQLLWAGKYQIITVTVLTTLIGIGTSLWTKDIHNGSTPPT